MTCCASSLLHRSAVCIDSQRCIRRSLISSCGRHPVVGAGARCRKQRAATQYNQKSTDRAQGAWCWMGHSESSFSSVSSIGVKPAISKSCVVLTNIIGRDTVRLRMGGFAPGPVLGDVVGGGQSSHSSGHHMSMWPCESVCGVEALTVYRNRPQPRRRTRRPASGRRQRDPGSRRCGSLQRRHRRLKWRAV